MTPEERITQLEREVQLLRHIISGNVGHYNYKKIVADYTRQELIPKTSDEDNTTPNTALTREITIPSGGGSEDVLAWPDDLIYIQMTPRKRRALLAYDI